MSDDHANDGGGHAAMNPSRFRLPHHTSPDRQRVRNATIRVLRGTFAWARDDGADLPPELRQLPPHCAGDKLPRSVDFSLSKKTRLLADKQRMKLNAKVAGLSGAFARSDAKRYSAMFRLVARPGWVVDRWREDQEFARQRLTGVNPMRLSRVDSQPPSDLTDAAQAVLSQRGHKVKVADLVSNGRLFETRYPELTHERIQALVKPGKSLAAPHCLFWVDDDDRLMPLAIQLWPNAKVFSPLSPSATWLLARSHAQAADGTMHEGTHHLLETHLVNEAVAMSLYRTVHSDHPLRQLLDPHYEGNLAIDFIARHNLLSAGGPIDVAMATGMAGTLEAARIHYATWSFKDAALHANLESRGLMDIPDHHYRDDALRVHAAIDHLVRAVLGMWYRTDVDVALDHELQAFIVEAGAADGGDIPGFPTSVQTRDSLFELVTHLIFRAGPQHAALNNGQFDAYGWTPNTPGALRGALPDDPEAVLSEEALWKAMPQRAEALAQMGMVWVLSRATRRTILHSGDAAAFDPALCFQAQEAIGAFRRRLQSISTSIRERNETLDVAYRYLDPYNISRSTDI